MRVDPGRGRPLQGKVAIVTGAAGGIGRATCEALLEAGAALVIVDLDPPRVEETARLLRSVDGGEVLGVPGDVRSPEAMDAMAHRALERFGRIDILVAAAGLLRGPGRPPRALAQVTLDEWNDVIGANLRGTFLCNRAVLPAMMRQRSGQIVNISSTSGRKGRALDSVYCASKFGVIGLSESEAKEVEPFGIRVHVILPGAVETGLWKQNGPIPCPPDSLKPARVADLILSLLLLPEDTQIPMPVIVPFRARPRADGGAPRERPAG